ncbi:tRNA 5-methylaminomethyl-2-thiouridine synthase TusB [hydrothermal vent metagenome]|uniref:tRNA 5-methylaminomethyl-2-thiouridine synthase TusB n=1 Tax=hydrothermal vent metagenome TaxID=652676 RepID=A0A3B1C4U5_9ZZZZ
MLHTVNKSPFNNSALDECVRFATKGSPILLLEDGIYAAKAGAAYSDTLAGILSNHDVYAIEADLEARGVNDITPGVKIIGYDGFVDLVEKHKTLPWV